MRDHRRNSNVQPANRNIRAEELQVISDTGENLGVMKRDKAIALALESDLDLVLIAEKGGDGLPVAKIMDLGKAMYQKKKKQAEAKKHQKVIHIKELKFRPKISINDFITKMNHAIQFLNAGKRVKFTLVFRGRELATKEIRGNEFFERIEKKLEDDGMLDKLIKDKYTKGGPIWSRIFYIK